MIRFGLPLLLLFCCSNLAAQYLRNFSSTIKPQGQTVLDFGQDLNIYQWRSLLSYQTKAGERLLLSLRENYRATLQELPDEDLWKDEQQFAFDLKYALSNHWLLKSSIDSEVLSDDLSTFRNRIFHHSADLGASFQPNYYVELSAATAIKWQSQDALLRKTNPQNLEIESESVTNRDRGLGLWGEATVNDYDYNGYRNNLLISGQQHFFPQRKNADFSLRYKVLKEFYSGTADTLILFFERLRRDSFDGDSTVFVRNLNQVQRGLENRLSYRVSADASAFFNMSVMTNSFRVHNIREDSVQVRKDDFGFESGNSFGFKIDKERWYGRIQWRYRQRTRDDNRPREEPDAFGRFPTIGFDKEDELVELTLTAGHILSNADSLGLYASVSKFQYDTSDTTNPNSHDQHKWQTTFSHKHRFNAALSLKWHISAFLNHFVFISSKLSGGNNWERNFQLAPEVLYSPGKHFSFRQAFVVRAKYQTSDFDDAATSNNNVVNRQFIMANNTYYEFASGNRIEGAFILELAEQGKLFYNLWRQSLALSWRKIEFRVLHKISWGGRLKFSYGGNFFKQIRWEHRLGSTGARERKLSSKHTNWGPVIEVVYQPGSNLELVFSGNIQIINSIDSRRKIDPIRDLDLHLNWLF